MLLLLLVVLLLLHVAFQNASFLCTCYMMFGVRSWFFPFPRRRSSPSPFKAIVPFLFGLLVRFLFMQIHVTFFFFFFVLFAALQGGDADNREQFPRDSARHVRPAVQRDDHDGVEGKNERRARVVPRSRGDTRQM